MKKSILLACILIAGHLLTANNAMAAPGLDEAFKLYAGSENLTFDAERGKQFWNKQHPASASAKGWEGKDRSCSEIACRVRHQKSDFRCQRRA